MVQAGFRATSAGAAVLGLAALLAGLPAPRLAAQLLNAPNDNLPLQVQADSGIEWQQNNQLYIARGNAVAIQADVAKRVDVKRLFEETMEKFGRPNILVNNAGVYAMGPLEAVTEEDFHRQFNTNVLGAILAAQEAVKAFNGSGGSIINFSTIWTTNPVPNSLVYSASKSAVDAVTRTLAIELAGRGIRVNAIAPGPTETEGLAAFGVTAETAKAMGFTLPMGRLGRPDDIARVALFLASDQSAWVTGERISVSGGER